jgi:hypothetical protein
MSGGQHRVDEVTRTESRRLDSKNNPRIAAHRPPKETADCAMQESVRKEQKKSQTLLTWPTSLEMLVTGLSRNIKGAHFAVGFDRWHHHLPKGAPL